MCSVDVNCVARVWVWPPACAHCNRDGSRDRRSLVVCSAIASLPRTSTVAVVLFAWVTVNAAANTLVSSVFSFALGSLTCRRNSCAVLTLVCGLCVVCWWRCCSPGRFFDRNSSWIHWLYLVTALDRFVPCTGKGEGKCCFGVPTDVVVHALKGVAAIVCLLVVSLESTSAIVIVRRALLERHSRQWSGVLVQVTTTACVITITELPVHANAGEHHSCSR